MRSKDDLPDGDLLKARDEKYKLHERMLKCLILKVTCNNYKLKVEEMGCGPLTNHPRPCGYL